MQAYLIHAANAATLILVSLGIPAITSRRLGAYQVTSLPDAHLLTLGLLGIATTVNLAGMLWLARGRKAQNLCRNWALIHSGVLLLDFLLYQRHIHFDWLKKPLLWIRQKFGR